MLQQEVQACKATLIAKFVECSDGKGECQSKLGSDKMPCAEFMYRLVASKDWYMPVDGYFVRKTHARFMLE